MFDFTPPSIAFSIGPVSVYYYGICYAVGLALAALVIAREARRRGLNVDELPNGMIVVAIAAVLGGRLYHVIDQWALYRDDPLTIILPPYTGLGVFGGIITGTISFSKSPCSVAAAARACERAARASCFSRVRSG